MAERTATLTFLARDAASGPVKAIDKALGGLNAGARRAGGGLKIAAGAIVDVGKLAAGAALAGVGALAAGLVYATKQAAEEEKGVDRLAASLTANIKGFDGNTAAIERAIKVGERKAFSDDAQRKSLAMLVARTKDVAKAQDLMSTAMDLARFKGISLEEASAALIKIEGGQFRALKALGIAVEPVTTAQDKLKNSTKTYTDAQMAAAVATDAAASSAAAIAAVQAVAAGQADVYGKSTAGAFESFKLALDNVVEDIGGFLLPIATRLAQTLTNEVIPAAQAIAATFGEWVAANRPLIDQIATFVGDLLARLVTFILGQVVPAAAALIERFVDFGAMVIRDIGPAVLGFIDTLRTFWTVVTTKIIPTVLDLAKRVWEGGLNKAVAAAYLVIGSVITVLTDLVTWITGNEPLMAVLRAAADGIGQAFGLAADMVTNTVIFLGRLGDAIRSNEAIMWTLARIGDAIGGAFKAVAGIIGGVIDAIRTAVDLAQQLADFVTGNGSATTPKPQVVGRGGRRALGGPVLPGGDYLVGEAGPEILRMGGTSGTIIPKASGGLSMSGVTINVSGAQNPDAIARDILQALKREVDRQGISLVPA